MLNFFRGERTYEDSGGGAPTDLFRLRDSILGDIINAQPSYVKKSPFGYADAGYAAFQTTTNSRRGTVYAAANDGYLHAFETDVNNSPYFQTAGIGTDITSDDDFPGQQHRQRRCERWAYVPGIVLPNAYKLANKPYSHRYFTDGSPQVGDICVTSTCGLSGTRDLERLAHDPGGRPELGRHGVLRAGRDRPAAERRQGAVGIHQPRRLLYRRRDRASATRPRIATSACRTATRSSPSASPTENGWSSSPRATTTPSGGGDGKGYLYILEAHTGKILHRLTTGVGTAASPSGLAKINGWATNSNIDNTVLAVYGGDLEGNLWRFQLDSTAPGYLGVVKVAAVTSAGGVPQPITVKPELGPVPNQPSDRMILFGTGKFLENTDKTDTSDQTIYALKDVPTRDDQPGDRRRRAQQPAGQGAAVRRLFGRRPDSHRRVRDARRAGPPISAGCSTCRTTASA